MANFYSRLSYSFGNEDWKTEHDALRLNSQDRVISITASGDRPLHLLLSDCDEVVAVDANQTQNHLLALKVAAMHELDFEEYLRFLGAVPSEDRKELFRRKVVKSLDDSAYRFWKEKEEMILKGVLYQGAVEQWCLRLSRILKVLRGNKVERLFACNDLESQREFLEKHWNTTPWKKAFDVCLNPLLTRFLIKDPGLYENIGTAIRPGSYIYQRMHNCLDRHLAKESALVSLILRGTVGPEAFPPSLTYEGYQTIKSRLSRLSFETKDVISYLESAPDESFSGFSLSDVASYIGAADFRRLLNAILRTARPNASFCLREFLSSQKMPEELAPHFERDRALEQRLQQDDRCFVYRYIVGNIDK